MLVVDGKRFLLLHVYQNIQLFIPQKWKQTNIVQLMSLLYPAVLAIHDAPSPYSCRHHVALVYVIMRLHALRQSRHSGFTQGGLFSARDFVTSLLFLLLLLSELLLGTVRGSKIYVCCLLFSR